jgi:hypothetical protein
MRHASASSLLEQACALEPTKGMGGGASTICSIAAMMHMLDPGERIDLLGRNLREMVHTPIKAQRYCVCRVEIKTANNHAFSRNSARVRRVTMCVQKVNPALYAATGSRQTAHARASDLFVSLTGSKASVHTAIAICVSRVQPCLEMLPASTTHQQAQALPCRTVLSARMAMASTCARRV